MLQTKYYYTSSDLLAFNSAGISRKLALRDITDFVANFDSTGLDTGKENVIYTRYSAVIKLFDYLQADNHFVFISETDYSDHEHLPRNEGTYERLAEFAGEDIWDFYRNLYLFLIDTTETYYQRLALYDEMIQHYTEKSVSTATGKTGISDMPITASFASAPSSDVLSNLSQTETSTETEPSTPLERYEAALNSTRSILKEWYDEYIRRLSIYE